MSDWVLHDGFTNAFDDFEIFMVSAEEVAFKVHSERIKSASPVFCEMAESCKDTDGCHIILVDEEIETTGAIDLFLHIVYGEPLPTLRRAKIADYVALCHFLKKYDCLLGLQTLRYALPSFMSHPGHCKSAIFAVAAILNEVQLCKYVLECGLTEVWTSHDSASGSGLEQCMKGRSIFEIGCMPISLATSIPFEYAYALTRAQSREVGFGGNLPEADWTHIIERFGKT